MTDRDESTAREQTGAQESPARGEAGEPDAPTSGEENESMSTVLSAEPLAGVQKDESEE